MTQDPLDIFVNQLLAEAKLDKLPDDYKLECTIKLKQQIEQRIGMMIMENLDQASLKEFTALLDTKKIDLNKVQEVFAAKIPGLPEKIKELLVSFAGEFITATKKPAV